MTLLPEILQLVQTYCDYRMYTQMRRTCKLLYICRYSISYNYNRFYCRACQQNVIDHIMIMNKGMLINFWILSEQIGTILAQHIRNITGDFNITITETGGRHLYNREISLETQYYTYHFTLAIGVTYGTYLCIADHPYTAPFGYIKVLCKYLYDNIPILFQITYIHKINDKKSRKIGGAELLKLISQ
jgi:hypothetical protein